MARRLVLPILLLFAASATAAPTPARAGRDARAELAAQWQEQGLLRQPSRGLDLLYLRPGAPASGVGVELAPVQVELRADWQLASRDLARARLRPAEVQKLKDEVALIVADELRRAFAGAPVPGASRLQARVLDLYLNAPDLQTASATRTYTRSFGDMVLVAELRDARGALLLGSWDHRPAREHAALRRTTQVENAIEIRAAARGWARQLRRELERLAGGG